MRERTFLVLDQKDNPVPVNNYQDGMVEMIGVINEIRSKRHYGIEDDKTTFIFPHIAVIKIIENGDETKINISEAWDNEVPSEKFATIDRRHKLQEITE